MSEILIAVGGHRSFVQSLPSAQVAFAAFDNFIKDFGAAYSVSIIRANGEYGAVYAPPVITEHHHDSQCSVDPKTLCCTECGVDHSNPCLACGGHGFHKRGCAEIGQ
jgi:hypothetical protein